MLGIVVFIFSFILVGCSHNTESKDHSASVKFDQYYLQGEQLYQTNCSNCHQKNGGGLGRLYPPLNNSDFLQNNVEEVICLMKNGRKGELIVNGKSFNKAMPAIPSLTDLEIAEISTYIYNTWQNNTGNIVEVKQVSAVLAKCKSN